jgi:YcxB-like protein
VFATPSADVAFQVRVSRGDMRMAALVLSRRWLAIYALLALVLVGFAVRLRVEGAAWSDPWLWGNLAGALFLLAYVPAAAWRAGGGEEAAFAGRHDTTFELRDAGIRTESARGHATFAWDELKRVEETSSLFLVYLTRRRALIVPKRCVGDAGAVDRVRQRLAERLPIRSIPF